MSYSTIKISAATAVALAILTASGTQVVAQHQRHTPPPASSTYVGLETRALKALSDNQKDDLKAGRGMRLALAAELNGYPGPLHVLELADKLMLSQKQRAQMQALIHAMKQETIAIGEGVIAAETTLDRLFAEKRADAASLSQAMKTVAHTQGRLREAHLRYHLDTRNALTPEQTASYARLRGYTMRP